MMPRTALRSSFKCRLLAGVLTLTVGAACGDPATATAETPASRAPGAASSAGSVAAPATRAPDRGPEHVVFDFGDNRPLAHHTRGGAPLAVAGAPGFAKYLRFAKPRVFFDLDEQRDGRAVAVASGNVHFDLPATAAQTSAPQLQIRLHSPGGRKVSLHLGEKSVANQDLVAGWQTASFALPAGSLKAGENRFMLAIGKGEGTVAVEAIQLGGPALDENALPRPFTEGRFTLRADEGLAWYVQVPAQGRLVGDVGGTGCAITVDAAPGEGAAVSGRLQGDGSAVDLSALSGQIVRLSLAVEGCAEAQLARSGLAVPGAAPVVTPVAERKRPKNIVFWIMDSLRADRVKPFWPAARPDVPVFEARQKDSAVFRNTYVQGNESRASHASIWSSQYPINHQMIVDGRKLDAARWFTLGEAMKKNGFFTSGVSSNGYIIAKWGFGEGWDKYRNHIHEGGGVKGENILDFGFKSLDGKTANPFFLYLGTIDTHVSWRAKEPWIKKYSPTYKGPYEKQASGLDVEKMAAGKIKPTEADKEHIRAIYDSNVSYQDKLLGDLFTKLEAWGVVNDTMVVVTADHGDEQWEDGRVGHGSSLRESLVRVPLLVHYPPLFPAGTVIEGADTVDILPTLLDALGQPIPDELQGESLVPIAQGVGRGYPRPSIASHYEFAHAMRLADWKVRVGGSGVPELYEVEKDPYEKQNLAASRPVERRFLTDVFSLFLVNQKHWRKHRWGAPSNLTPAFMADQEKR
ncbi:MAG: sulfatase [Bradymonadia bacterium]